MLGYIVYKAAEEARKNRGAPVGIKRGADILDGPYPKSMADFIGQDRARLQIMATISSAAVRGVAMDHILLASGTPGVGKTALARLTAALRGTGFVELGGAVTDKDAIKALKQMEDKDILFIDEIHRLAVGNRYRSEWLLTLLQDGIIQTPQGAFRAPNITVIGATTDAQKLPETILDRFVVKPVLDAYTGNEAVEIARVTAKRLGFGDANLPMPDEDDWLLQVTDAGDRNPRRMTQILSVLRDVALSDKLSNLTPTGYDLTVALSWCGLTFDGLTQGMQEYLITLLTYGGKAGLATMKAALNENEIGQTEKGLIQRGMVTVTAQGRELSESGATRASELAEQHMATHVAREELPA